MLVIADDKIPFLKNILEPFADVEYLPADKITPEKVKDADALLIRTRTKCDQNLLEGSKVKFIGTATIGFDHIDTRYCRANGITWTNAPGCNAASVNQYVASALATISRRKKFELKNKVLGIVGVGNVGRKIVRTAELFNMRVYLNDPPRVRSEGLCGFVSLDSILRECDIITFHVPLNYEGIDKTFHLVDEKFLGRVNRGTIIINTSRGEVADTRALKYAVKEQIIDGLVLDVWENEPDIDRELLSLADIGTPHIAGYSADGKAKGTAMVVSALSRFFGLGIDNWEPEDIPLPEITEISIDCKHMDVEQVLCKAILATYNVDQDDHRLRASTETFEKQRGDYPLRREFHAYTIKLINEHSDIKRMLMKMGFKVNT